MLISNELRAYLYGLLPRGGPITVGEIALLEYL